MPKVSRDQKRKKKLDERKQRQRQFESPGYQGEKYKTTALAPLWYETENAIYQAFLLTDRTLYDLAVHAALKTLIGQLRSGPLPPPTEEIQYVAGQEDALVRDLIVHHWTRFFVEHERPSKDDQLGVLRSVLGTAEYKKDPGPSSRRYLVYIEDFLTRSPGAKVQQRLGESLRD